MPTNSITDPARSEADSVSSTDVAVADKSPLDMSTDPADIMVPLIWHISRDSTTRELVRLKCVSKLWKTLVSNHIPMAAKTRWEDDTKDWYFPLRFQIHRDNCKRTPHTKSWLCSCGKAWTGSWTWSAVHHSSGEIHSLPPVPSGGGFEPHFDRLIASAGGLLLFMDKLPSTEREFNQPIASRLSEEASAAWLRQDRASFSSIDQVWRPLLVSNPLTKEWRILPAADPRDLERAAWGYVGFRAHMVVDEKANAYKVILTFTNFLLIYKSTSNCWTCRAFPDPTPWGFTPFFPRSREFSLGPSAIVCGKLYFAALEVFGTSMPFPEVANDTDIRNLGCVKVYEIDEQAGTWKPPVRYKLRNYIPKYLRLYFHLDLGFRLGSYAIGVVECMGSMYAIIPARLNVNMTMDTESKRRNDLDDRGSDHRYYQYGYLPLQFYVLQLRQGADLALGRLLMQIPRIGDINHAESEYSRRRNSMLEYRLGDYMCVNPHKVPTKISTWFRCTARGSVIWVTFLDYLLQYDVVSGQSKTQILPDTSFAPAPDLSYRPSFYMKP